MPSRFDEHLDPVVEPADHHRHDGRHQRRVPAVRLAAREPALDGLGDRERLRDGEADGRVDRHAGGGHVLDRPDPGGGRRHLDLHVRRQRREAQRLLGDPPGVAVVLRVRLDRQAALASPLALEHRQQDLGAAHGDLLDQPPRDLVLGPRRVVRDQRRDAVAPEVQLLLQHLADDGRVARGPGRAARHRVGQLLDGRRVVPVVRRRRRRHLLQRARDHLGRDSHLRPPVRTG